MPSRHQSGNPGGTRYETAAKKMLATKNDLTIAALIRGIRKVDRAQAYIEAEVELADEEDRDVRTGIVGACNRKKTALEDEDTVDTPVDVDTGTGTDDDEDADTPAHDPEDDDDSDDVQQDTDDDPYADVEHFDTVDALEDHADDHEHGDVFTTAKPDGTLAGCFECESHIGFVPTERDGGFDG